MKPQHIKHLYNRIGFGITPENIKTLQHKTKKEVINDIFKNSESMSPIKIDISHLKNLNKEDLKDSRFRQKLNKISREKIRDFSDAWLNQILNPKEILREKMILFWANHFVCQNNTIQFIQKYHNTIRQNALGDFKSFTKAISKEPAMIIYLNNKQNKKGSPNENFARELMELFTLGQGNYTEFDIKESARSFTGYNNNFIGKFVFRKRQHDATEKEFFGKKGNFNGDDIIDIILEKRECAEFISKKIFTYFVNDKPNKKHIAAMTTVFYKDYNIEKLMRFVLESDWFYDDENIGVKIKSPMEFIAGINTIVPFQFLKPKQTLLLQRLLGQVLMRPPNVAGWKTGKYWIDSNTIVTRLRLPSILLNNAEITYSEKGDEESMMNNLKSKKLRRKTYIKTATMWAVFDENFKETDNKELLEHLIYYTISPKAKAVLLENKTIPKRDFCVQIMSLPEYQLC